MKLWQGRLSGDIDDRIDKLNSSIGFDCRMYKQDIEGSIAHASMLKKQGIIDEAEADKIIAGLKGILADIVSGALEIDMTAEDIHTFVELTLTERIGDAGKRLHTARSRNDQVATDLRLYSIAYIDTLTANAKKLCETLCAVAEKHIGDVMPGYTHLQRAQPVTLAHALMAYVWMLLRDIDRLNDCKKRAAVLPLGSGALAGTTYLLDRQYTASLLGMNGISENSMDGVSDRDFALELLSCLSIIMVHLSRFSEEIILWCSHEFSFMSLSDSFSTGSSIMPQKKNPDIAELVRGKAGRVFGDSMTLLTVMKGLPLSYNKDMQEDKEALFDALDTVSLCLELMAPMIESATFKPENMKKAAAKGFINATDCADYLVKKGMPFRDAYKIVGELVRYCVEKDTTLEELNLDDYKGFSESFDKDVFEAIDLSACLSLRAVDGGPAPTAEKKQIEKAKKLLGDI